MIGGILMLKRISALLVTLCVLCSFGTVYAFDGDAFAGLEMLLPGSVHTVLVDMEGDSHRLDGMLTAKALKASGLSAFVASYAVFRGETELFKTELHEMPLPASVFGVAGTPASNGYYSVTFTLSATENTQCFLTGLTAANLDLVQTELVSAELSGSSFTIESLDFIDAEKERVNDTLLCWAASTSNILQYTGWLDQVGDYDEDDLFDTFVSSFTDGGGNALYGVPWFFDGHYQPQGIGAGWAQVKDYGVSGGLLPSYDALEFLEEFNLGTEGDFDELATVFDRLEAGYGTSLGLAWLDADGNRDSGHAITLWGYIVDEDYAETDKAYYQALIVSDSDSDIPKGEDRRTAPDVLHVFQMLPYEKAGYDSWEFAGYGGGNGVLTEATVLAPYMAGVPYETDGAAKLDRFNYVDFIPYLDIENSIGKKTSLFAADDDVVFRMKIRNESNQTFNDDVPYSITVTEKANPDNTIGKSTSLSVGAFPSYVMVNFTQQLSDLTPGDYTVTFAVNPEKTVEEAYYYQNAVSMDFTVSETSYNYGSAEMNVSLGEFNRGKALATVICTELDSLKAQVSEDAETEMYLLYMKDGNYTAYQKAIPGTEPDTYLVDAAGDYVQFVLVISDPDGKKPDLVYESSMKALTYHNMQVRPAPDNSGNYTKLEAGANQLATGENFSFVVENTSTKTDAINYTVTLLAENGTESVPLYTAGGLSLEKGATAASVTVISWDSAIVLSGQYTIRAQAVSDDGTAIASTILGTLQVGDIVEPPVEILGISEGKIQVYAPKAQRACLVVTGYGTAGKLQRLRANTVNLATGMNHLDLDSAFLADHNIRIMLWNNLTDIQPLCESLTVTP